MQTGALETLLRTLGARGRVQNADDDAPAPVDGACPHFDQAPWAQQVDAAVRPLHGRQHHCLCRAQLLAQQGLGLGFGSWRSRPRMIDSAVQTR